MSSWVVAMVVATGLLSACGSSSSTSSTSSTRSSLQGTLTVAAAASLQGTFSELGASFERAHPGVRVRFSFGSSGILEQQLAHGAPADVFASADTAVMQRAVAAGSVDANPVIFATNTLSLVTRPGNPLGIRSLADLSRADVVAICADKAPCGTLATKALADAGVTLAISKITRGQDVRATLRQVTEGDADVAIVYRTDARTVGTKGTAVAIPVDENLVTSYPVGVVHGTTHGPLARAWIAYLRSSTGRAVLRRAGFGTPDAPRASSVSPTS